MIVAWTDVVLALVGALTFAFARGDVKELGRIAFFVGLFWVAYRLSGHVLTMGR